MVFCFILLDREQKKTVSPFCVSPLNFLKVLVTRLLERTAGTDATYTHFTLLGTPVQLRVHTKF